ncbi:MAG: tetratricopeptide repeat-containing sensor histidine kinase, partial [Chitinophagaceae bacterium]
MYSLMLSMKYYLCITLWLLGCCFAGFGQSAATDSMLQVVSLNKKDDAEMKALTFLAIDCHRTQPNLAKKYLLQCIKTATDAGNYDRQCGAYTLLLSILQEEGKRDSAVFCVNKLKLVAAKAPDNNKVQTNFNQALGLYHRKNGDYKAALPYTLAAARLAEASGISKTHTAGQWLNAGVVYESMGDYKNAMITNLRALKYFEEAGSKLGESFCYNNIADIHYNLKQYKKSLEYAQKSLQLKRSLGDQRGICTSLESTGNAYLGLNNLPQALINYEAALKIAIAEKMSKEEAISYFNIAKVYSGQQKTALAESYFNKSKIIAQQIDNRLLAANVEVELATLLKNADSTKATESSLVLSMETFKESGSMENEAANYQRLSEFYAGNKQFEKALEYSHKFHAVKDSIAGNTVQLQLKNLEEQYNSDKKEREIQLLKKEGELQQQKLYRQRMMSGAVAALLLLSVLAIALVINRNRLKQKMKELELRNQIAADLHDEVGSSLSSIHMLSQMANSNANETTQKDILQRMSSNAKETMDKMGDIVWMIKPGETEAGSLKQRMERFAHEICSSKN